MSGFLTHDEAVARIVAQCAGVYGAQRALAEKSGVSVVMINHILHGRRSLCPRVAVAAGLIAGFQIQESSVTSGADAEARV